MKVLLINYTGTYTTDELLREEGHEVDTSYDYHSLKRENKQLCHYDMVFAHQRPKQIAEVISDSQNLETRVYVYSGSIRKNDDIAQSVEQDGNIFFLWGMVNSKRIIQLVKAASKNCT